MPGAALRNSKAPAAFAVVLLLNLNLNLLRCQAESSRAIACAGPPLPVTRTVAGSSEGTATRGESLLSARKTCVPSRSARKWGLAERASTLHPHPPRPRLLVRGAGFDVKPPHFSISTQTQFQNIPLSFLVVDFYLKWSWLFYFEPLMEVHLGVVRLGGGLVRHLQFIFPCVITLRVCSVVFD